MRSVKSSGVRKCFKKETLVDSQRASSPKPIYLPLHRPLGPMFVPFLGGYISCPSHENTPRREDRRKDRERERSVDGCSMKRGGGGRNKRKHIECKEKWCLETENSGKQRRKFRWGQQRKRQHRSMREGGRRVQTICEDWNNMKKGGLSEIIKNRIHMWTQWSEMRRGYRTEEMSVRRRWGSNHSEQAGEGVKGRPHCTVIRLLFQERLSFVFKKTN